MKINPNDICLIVGERCGCEMNIGATIRAVERFIVRDTWYWSYDEPSRSLYHRDVDTGQIHADWDIEDCEWCGIEERYLMPLLPDENPVPKVSFLQNELPVSKASF